MKPLSERLKTFSASQFIDWLCLACVDVREVHTPYDAQEEINKIREALTERLSTLQQQLTATNNSLTNAQEALKSVGIEADTVQAGVMELVSRMNQVVAENAAFKDINAWCKTDAFENMYREFKTAEAIGCPDVDCMHDAMLTAIMHAPETPATDVYLNAVRAEGVVMLSQLMKENGHHHHAAGARAFAAQLRAGNAGKNGWIEWGGGERPVRDDVQVEVRFRDGKVIPSESACYWNWHRHNSPADIIAYRVIKDGSHE